MKYALIVWSLLNFALGVFLFAAQQSIRDSILCGVAFLIATVAIGAAGIIEAVEKNTKKLEWLDKKNN